MKSKFFLFVVVLMIIVAASLSAQSQERAIDDALKTIAGVLADDLVSGKATAVAIAEFGNPDGTVGGRIGALGRYIAYAFPAYLKEAGRGRFILVDRDATSRILEEQEFQLSALGSPAGQVTVGNLLACDALVLGTIDTADPSALMVAARAVSVERGTCLGSFAKRLPLSMEVKALSGVAAVAEGAALRLNAAAEEPYGLAVIGSDGVKTAYASGADSWITAKPGEEYRIELRNDTDRRVAVALLIDGLNTAFMRREAPSAAVKWVLEPRSRAIVAGWQQDGATARKFVFTGKRDSLAASQDYGAEIGLISASFYPEELTPKSGAEQQAGTAAGAAFGQKTRSVSLTLESGPAQVAVLRYDYAAGLAARGIKTTP